MVTRTTSPRKNEFCTDARVTADYAKQAAKRPTNDTANPPRVTQFTVMASDGAPHWRLCKSPRRQ